MNQIQKYTLLEAREIIQEEQKNYIRQKLAGAALIIISGCLFFIKCELTICFVIAFIGFWLLITKEKDWGNWD